MANYYGKAYVGTKTFNPADIVQVNTAATLTNVSVNKLYMLNSPATYTITLPQISTIALGDEFTFVHNNLTGVVTLTAYAGNFIQVIGVNVTGMTINPGETVILKYTGTVWNFIDSNKAYTQPQGTNDNTPASTAFVQNEVNKHRNLIINGNFDIWQRGTSLNISTSVPQYLADRWQTGCTGSIGVASRQAFTLGQGVVPGEPSFFHRVIVSSAAGSGNFSSITHKVESVKTFAGKTATLSFWAKADSNKNIAVGFNQVFGSGGSPSASILGLGVTTLALTTSFQKFTVQVTLPVLTGKTLGTNGDDYITVAIWFEAGSSFSSITNALGQQSGTFDIAQVQFEEGSVATQFENRSITTELSMAQRYYEKSYDLNVVPGTTGTVGAFACVAGAGGGIGTVVFNMPYKVSKRTTPTVTIYNHATGAPGTIRDTAAVADRTISSITNAYLVFVSNTVSTTASIGYYAAFTADAEL